MSTQEGSSDWAAIKIKSGNGGKVTVDASGNKTSGGQFMSVEADNAKLTLTGNKTHRSESSSDAPMKKARSGVQIFVSHRATDVALVKALVDCLNASLEVPDKAIRCTSVPGYGLAAGDRSGDELRQNLEQCSVVIGVLTEQSIESAWVCAELGAAWMIRKRTCPLLSPSVDFSKLPGPVAGTHAIRTTNTHDIHGLIDVVATETGLPPRNTTARSRAAEEFVATAQRCTTAATTAPPENSSAKQDITELRVKAPGRIKTLEKWVSLLKQYEQSRSRDEWSSIQTEVNRMVSRVSRIVAEAGVSSSYIYTPPPAVGGYTVRVDVIADPFASPNGRGVVDKAIAAADSAIGVYEDLLNDEAA